MTRPISACGKLEPPSAPWEGAAHVDGKEPSPEVVGHVFDLQMLIVVIVGHGIHSEGGVVDENVHSPEPLSDSCDLPAAILWI
jgi:hypothetical protein